MWLLNNTGCEYDYQEEWIYWVSGYFGKSVRTHPAALQYGWGRGKKVGYSKRERERVRKGGRRGWKQGVSWYLVGPRCLVFTPDSSSLLSNNESDPLNGAAAQPILQQERGAIEFGFYHVWDDTVWKGERAYAGGERVWWQCFFLMLCVCVCVMLVLSFFNNHALCSLMRWSAAATLMDARPV